MTRDELIAQTRRLIDEGERIAASPRVNLDLATVQTNIIVFRLKPGAPDAATVVARSRERGVLLVDDVLTTGATIDACTRALQRAGARHVDVLTLARVVRPAL